MSFYATVKFIFGHIIFFLIIMNDNFFSYFLTIEVIDTKFLKINFKKLETTILQKSCKFNVKKLIFSEPFDTPFSLNILVCIS